MADYIERAALYNKIAALAELARNRYLDTPGSSPAYPRYREQLSERTALKHLVADFPAAADVAPVPLTLEQLREMDGQKVLLYRMKSTEPLEPGTVKQNGDVLGDAGMLAYHELYLETWVAFTYPPAHIDMEAWSGCVCTASDKSCCSCVSMNCHTCIRESEYKRGHYCSACGRPLTEEARAELEKRLRGGA